MKNQLTLLNYIIISLLLVGVLIANILFLHSSILGLILGLFYLIFYGWILGAVLFPNKDKIFQALYGSLFLLSGFSLAGAIIYYIWQLNTLIIILLLIVIPVLLSSKIKKLLKLQLPKLRVTDYKLQVTRILLATYYLLLIFTAFYLLAISQTTEAVRSPWDVVPWQFFVIYLLATICLLFIIYRQRTLKINLILIIIHFFLAFSVAWIIYPIGYGFDSFIHQATEKVIALQGFISPKPFYYIGQYSLVVFLSRLFQISVIWIDKLLLPVLTAIYLPTTIYYGFKKLTNGLSLFLIFYFLFLIFNIFIVTTPQGLANLFILIIIFLSLSGELRPIQLIFLGLTALFIHPLAGIPALIFLIILLAPRIVNRFRVKPGVTVRGSKLIIGLILGLSIIALPTAFLIISRLSPTVEMKFTPANFLKLFTSAPLDFYWQNKFNLLKNLIYFYGHNLIFFFLLVTAIGAIVLWRKKLIKPWLPYLTTFAVLLINYVLLKGLFTFQFLIVYERDDFTSRLLEISFYFLIPLFLYSLCIFTQKVWQKISWLHSPEWSRSAKNNSMAPVPEKLCYGTGRRLGPTIVIWLFFIACLITVSLYFTYPKNDDNYEVSHAFNVSTSDIKAVRLIAETAGNKDYIVLANQSVSAAAVREFGFKKYYQVQEAKASTPNTIFRETSIFYYPIPTSSPLYQYYLEMVYKKASRETMREAMDLVGVREAYLVVNNYWWAWPRIVEQAKTSADSWLTIDNGKIWVFKYSKAD